MTGRPTVAVVGSGVSGLTAAYLLSRTHDVTLYEADDRPGGHAHTHELATSDGGISRVDTGFIVHNDRTYPNLLRLFGELGVSTQDSDMSMSVRCDGCGLEYAGAQRIGGLFPRASNAVRPQYLRMLGEVVRFHRHARRVLADEAAGDVTLGAFLAIGGYSRYFVQHFMIPVVSCVWSAGAALSMSYPARYLFTFLDHHGMLAIGGSPQWRTVTGGSRSYVDRIVKQLPAVRTGTPVRSVLRTPAGVEVRDDGDAVAAFDRIVVATHPDQALRLLGDDATAAEREVLGAFEYSRNETWLHHDASLLPRARGARASWNYLKPACADSAEAPVLVSYDMNRLMRLTDPDDWVVTLNGSGRVSPDAVVARMQYEHPIYTPTSVAAQRRLPELDTPVTAFAGAYHGWGFHEDGCASGVRAARALGVAW
ncbi:MULTISPECIES: FAD-dependent oxidoreductase [unclassified Pseudonocardia]|uniref:NAD(P)/FAD-dependent oxidoreductase n=1 Tax=unclassified Pseudonocardia TaxID=2619320 RepID=UPI0001FFE522|nr:MULTISPECIES: FAD-dependent oxidoreductase [unclassified Pseudonocardia]ALE74476.1 amine oxidase [Pseudonocardia sp. EC080625-04]ALL77898.1 amine oxidase [Pseudonocardia sp. EC080610-09]ALL80812.1 amine oxidase [Pseudonocardia sp. EC080619-01]OLM17214.1 amine oxidase, flavin-containing protein [Pseudonocardia sp. Ae707_Ps1]